MKALLSAALMLSALTFAPASFAQDQATAPAGVDQTPTDAPTSAEGNQPAASTEKKTLTDAEARKACEESGLKGKKLEHCVKEKTTK